MPNTVDAATNADPGADLISPSVLADEEQQPPPPAPRGSYGNTKLGDPSGAAAPPTGEQLARVVPPPTRDTLGAVK